MDTSDHVSVHGIAEKGDLVPDFGCFDQFAVWDEIQRSLSLAWIGVVDTTTQTGVNESRRDFVYGDLMGSQFQGQALGKADYSKF